MCLLISQYILAAHCFQNKGLVVKCPAANVLAILGKFDLNVDDEHESKKHSVRDIILHPDWKFSEDKYDADIAVVVLTQKTEYSNGIWPICLPLASNEEVVGTGTVVGWGKSQHSEGLHYSATPNKIEIPAVNSSHCYTTTDLGQISSVRAFCGGYENQEKGPCLGDSGSGFFIRTASNWVLQGIVSSGLFELQRGCDINTFSLYTNVARFIEWITQTVEDTVEVEWSYENIDCDEKTL